MIFALPPEASSGVFRQVREEHRTTAAETTARQDFSDLLGELFSRIVDAIPLPKPVREVLGTIRDGIVNAASALWHRFFEYGENETHETSMAPVAHAATPTLQTDYHPAPVLQPTRWLD